MPASARGRQIVLEEIKQLKNKLWQCLTMHGLYKKLICSMALGWSELQDMSCKNFYIFFL